jgi:segregation and condensation protein A
LLPMSQDDEHGSEMAGFEVHLDVFEGPFDLLLALISKHKLDITEVSLSKVTDEFITYLSQRSDTWDLDQVSYFLVVAATLLDLKAARLLPSGEVEDEEDLALLEARDLLFARLLQYRAYKEVAAVFAAKMALASRRFPRRVPLEPRFAELFEGQHRAHPFTGDHRPGAGEHHRRAPAGTGPGQLPAAHHGRQGDL